MIAVIVPRHTQRSADALHRSFRDRPGSEFIASGFALAHVARHIRRRRPGSVLELGAGIGALTAGIAAAIDEAGLDASQVAIEQVPFCLDQLRGNLGRRLDAVVICPSAAAVPDEVAPYDLVVIDGGASSDLLPEDRHRWSEADERPRSPRASTAWPRARR